MESRSALADVGTKAPAGTSTKTSTDMGAKASATMKSSGVLGPGGVGKRADAQRDGCKTQAGPGGHNNLPGIVTPALRCFHPYGNPAPDACQALLILPVINPCGRGPAR